MHRYLQENKLISIKLQDQGNSMNRRGHVNNKNKSDINKKHNGLTDKIDRTTDDRMVLGNYFKNFKKECKLMGNLEGWGYVQMPVEHNYADLYLLITPEGGQMISLLYYNLYITIITNNLVHMYRGGYMCATYTNHHHYLSCYNMGYYGRNTYGSSALYALGYHGTNLCADMGYHTNNMDTLGKKGKNNINNIGHYMWHITGPCKLPLNQSQTT